MPMDPESSYIKYGPMVLRRCRQLLRNESDAADAMQDTFVKLLRYQARLADESPATLLYTMATNVCLNRIRDGKPAHPDSEEMLGQIASAEDLGERLAAVSVLNRIFSTEKVSTRAIATMIYLDGMTLEETAVSVKLSVSAVRKRLARLKIDIQKEKVNL